MAIRTTPPQDQVSDQKKHYGPHHTAFSWLWSTEIDHRAEFVELTYDVTRGIETVLNVVMNSQLHQQSHGDECDDPDDRPLFSKADNDRLVRLALASVRLLGDEAGVLIDGTNHRKSEGKK